MEETMEKVMNNISRTMILTPYLAEILGTEGGYKLRPTDIYRTKVDTEFWRNAKVARELLIPNDSVPKEPLLVIAGQTRIGEEEVRDMKDLGFVVARYSVFYGGRSRYTGASPDEAGYSLDMPKDPQTAGKLLANQEVYEALESRNKSKIEKAIANFNENGYYPIRITSFLEEALKIS
tara:strand:- start:1373 stop:1906 length:534 start_codon:yes stop_codon:yes gene_type:complete